MNVPRMAALFLGNTLRLRTPAIAVACAALLAAACSGPLGTASKPTAPRCADLVAHAVTTQPPQPVVGSYACLAPSLQAEANLLGITDDASFASFEASQTSVETAYHYVGRSVPNLSQPGATVYYYFELTPAACYRLSLDANGLVNGGGFGPANCPKQLP